ncbi:tetraspanin-31 isoform X3 [Lingula anatina]|uniref:Tetraspanin-31 isoform X3 n=1 Tax=Lingula anatina TaxID=7574 RepID=A0A1S3H8Q6_LINAN|nr:tetraspanin-31 isoform X3 [Lingula anatina]|eukprot:XP_013382393.1 tetraspanin-31 isoform X3 [Lingula anatina]
MCGGFSCSKNALAALNILYILVSFILIGVAAYAKAMAVVTSLALVGGIIACGVFLLLIAIIGLIGAIKHHQVLLFFYMLILFLLFLVQFAISCACLAVNESQQQQIAQAAWKIAEDDLKMKIQELFECCGFDTSSQALPANDSMSHPDCLKIKGCVSSGASEFCCNLVNGSKDSCPVEPCFNNLRNDIQTAFKISGGIGLFFSFTEIVGVWLAIRFRNQKDPRANPNAFL